jgi:phosphoribosylglycinamide formyltransferase-1
MRLRLALIASHGGSNLQAILDACRDGSLDADPRFVISNNSEAKALERARAGGVPAYHLSAHTHPEPDRLDAAIVATLERHGVNLVVLAGYMKKLGPRTLGRYSGRVLNIHPALLPKFGGQGMYGMRVHQAVLAAGEKVTGVTVHIVDEAYDRGPILAQRTVPIREGDTPDTLADRVLQVEHEVYVDTLQRIARGEIRLSGLSD